MVKEKAKIIFENAIYLIIVIRFSGYKMVFNLGISLKAIFGIFKAYLVVFCLIVPKTEDFF